jgi:pimeloyl-ACP methyl ester carboxylesterase
MDHVKRQTVEVDGVHASYLTAGEGPLVLLLHGTYWSRVWLPVLGFLAEAGLRPVAVDLPGFGYSGGELSQHSACAPRLTAWLERFLAELGASGTVRVAGHDIGGALAQRLLVESGIHVPALALINAVTYDSWPVPSVARFHDHEVVAATTAEDLVELRRPTVRTALGRAATPALIDEYLDPLHSPRVARSWMALAGAADSRYTLELMPAMRACTAPKLLVWGEDDGFQRVEYAERFAADVPNSSLLRIGAAGHIPTESEPSTVGGALAEFFSAN